MKDDSKAKSPAGSRAGRPRKDALAYQVADFAAKSTTSDIAQRFDGDVDHSSNLETGQSATIDAPLSMQLITEAAVRLTPNIKRCVGYRLTYQIDLLHRVGFAHVELLHKNSCFAAFGAWKA